ncbi:hypothetical protein BDZ90DRAFT_180658 [Jaminaea rosea]|uniref:Peptidase S54 rhomboid domain-containing protein n=1 Tax=Jaminaea rosea TaxID=1569628 RepID=A0A316UQC1_9BASI|nr:hypothetical protein BDZ90DRAFT_180658 [Jaminaea rosea]PWN27499.1 hypothetical protein BDZ90DRAFT_180658 [Jaminaea rosea]
MTSLLFHRRATATVLTARLPPVLMRSMTRLSAPRAATFVAVTRIGATASRPTRIAQSIPFRSICTNEEAALGKLSSPKPIPGNDVSKAKSAGSRTEQKQSKYAAPWPTSGRWNGRKWAFWITFPLIISIVPASQAYGWERVWARKANMEEGWMIWTIESTWVEQDADSATPAAADLAKMGLCRRLVLHDLSASLYRSLKDKVAMLDEAVAEYVLYSYGVAANWYLNAPSNKVATAHLIALNTAVFLAWRVAALRRPWTQFMLKYFMDRPFPAGQRWRRSGNMYRAPFSHPSLAHFLVAQAASWSVAPAALQVMEERMQSNPGAQHKSRDVFGGVGLGCNHLLWATFLTSAIGGAFFSRRWSYELFRHCTLPVERLAPGEVRPMMRMHWRARYSGAGAGIFGLLSFVVQEEHQAGKDADQRARLALPFLRSEYTLPARETFLVLCAFDALCILRGVRVQSTSSAARLGGAVWGLLCIPAVLHSSLIVKALRAMWDLPQDSLKHVGERAEAREGGKRHINEQRAAMGDAPRRQGQAESFSHRRPIADSLRE